MSSHAKKIKQRKIRAKIDNSVKDYGNDPFFVKKANDSKEFLEKHGLPKDFTRKK